MQFGNRIHEIVYLRHEIGLRQRLAADGRASVNGVAITALSLRFASMKDHVRETGVMRREKEIERSLNSVGTDAPLNLTVTDWLIDQSPKDILSTIKLQLYPLLKSPFLDLYLLSKT